MYSLVLNRRHAVIVDMANFKGPELSQLFDSTAEILLIVFVSTTDQITPIFIKICLEITELWSLKNLSSPCFRQVRHVFVKFAVSSIKHQRVSMTVP